MPRLEIATAEMFEDIFPLLASHNPRLPKERWRLLFDYRWRGDGDGLGYVLIKAGTVVGFLSTLYSRRVIDGREEHLCNLAHWVVREDCRADSLRLLAAAARQRDCTITSLTSSPRVAALLGKLGFTLLDDTVQVFVPRPRLDRRASREASVSSELGAIRSTLNDEDSRIYRDHVDGDCHHVVVRAFEEYCYVVFAKRSRRAAGVAIPFAQLHYVSNARLFLQCLPEIQRHCFRHHGVWLIAGDQRLTGPASGVRVRYALRAPRYYRSATLAPGQIDNLYSDLALGV